MKHQARTLRIIGGNWRSRKVTFPDSEEIRPTGDRIRETLFNWLMHDVAGGQCLDLFAGSGILGLEALSRGAAHVTFADRDPKVIKTIEQNLQTLQANPSQYELKSEDAISWLKNNDREMDIVFLDPPFADPDLLYRTIELLAEKQTARQWVYVETSGEIDTDRLPNAWQVHRSKSAGDVNYALLTV